MLLFGVNSSSPHFSAEKGETKRTG
jgi:hypothetical protein